MNYLLKNDFLTVTISGTGAEMQSVLGCDGTEYIWRGDPASWDEHAPILFPFCGRQWDGCYTVNGVPYSLGIHGFFRSLPVQPVKKDASSVTFSQESTAETLNLYPFPYRVDVTYTLTGRSLVLSATVFNKGEKTMPFAFGLHPGFSMPFAGGELNDYVVRFVGADGVIRQVNFDENECFPVGGTRPFALRDKVYLDPTEAFFAIGSAFFDSPSDTVVLEKKTGGRKITMRFPSYRYFGLWKAPLAPFLCLEPWTAMPPLSGKVSELNERDDLCRLAPDASMRFDCTIEFA